jgi:DNA-directed RNA polymerase beta' subunit
MEAILDKIQFGILSSSEIIRQSVCEITNTKLNGINSIYDERMGILENGKLCITCNKNNKECIGHFGHIRLNVSISHPMYYKSILNVLRCVCYQCSKVLMSKDQFEFHGLLKHQKQNRFTRVLKILEKNDICLACHSVQPKYLFAVNDKTISMIFKMNGESRKTVLFDYEIKKIFENMSDEDVSLLGFDVEHSHPKNLIIEILPVLPPVARPYIISDNVTCDDDLTIQYLEIIKANIHLVVDSSLNEVKRQRYIQSLKFRIKCLFDNSQERSKHSNGRPLKGIKKRLTGKEGQLRNNLMGKRVDKSARTVIGPDPTLKVNEIAIPHEIADVLTYPIRVTDLNKQQLTDMLYTHKINYVLRKDGGNQRINMKYALFKQESKLQFGDYIQKKNGKLVFIKNEKQFFLLEPEDLVIRNGNILHDFVHPQPKDFQLNVGDIIERKLQDDDIVLLNRQPTLHKGSMIAFNVKIREGKTIRTNLAVTKSFNAD